MSKNMSTNPAKWTGQNQKIFTGPDHILIVVKKTFQMISAFSFVIVEVAYFQLIVELYLQCLRKLLPPSSFHIHLKPLRGHKYLYCIRMLL